MLLELFGGLSGYRVENVIRCANLVCVRSSGWKLWCWCNAHDVGIAMKTYQLEYLEEI